MFEKEAEERARKLEESQTLGVYDNDEDYARDSGWNDGEVAGYEEGFKDGAEFGYSKANEWHYVKDGDLPKEEGEYLCAFDFHKRYALDIEFIFINNEDKHYFDNLAWDINKLVAWKEIVPPKESE